MHTGRACSQLGPASISRKVRSVKLFDPITCPWGCLCLCTWHTILKYAIHWLDFLCKFISQQVNQWHPFISVLHSILRLKNNSD